MEEKNINLPETHQFSATFIGHSTVLLNIGGTYLLTDPVFSRWIWTLRRRSKVGIKPEDLPPVDFIFLSHGHYDHLDTKSLKKLPRSATVLSASGIGRYARRLGFTDVRTLQSWEKTTDSGFTITAVPANHFSGRSPFNPVTNFQGFVVEGEKTVYFAGDTGLFDEMFTIGKRFSIDLALLPIGAYHPWHVYGHHMTPEDAIEAGNRKKKKKIIPVHWGAFRLSFEPINEPPQRLLKEAEKQGMAERIFVLQPGETATF